MWCTLHIPPTFYLASHYQTHPQCLALSSPVVAVGICMCTIPLARSMASLPPQSICRRRFFLLRADSSELCVSFANLLKWTPQGVGKIDHQDKILRSKKKKAHSGLLSQLKAIEGALLHYIFEFLGQGVMVNTFMVTLRASFILTRVQCKELRSTLQLCEAFFDCPFVLISNGHAYLAALSGQS